MSAVARALPMRADFDRVVRILARNLYGSWEAVVRELVQNASDAISRREERCPGHTGRIEVETRPEHRLLAVRDDGIGMSRREIERFLTVVGASGTAAAAERLEARADEARAESLIGAFGVGMLSALLVGRRLEVRTRRLGSRRGWCWEWDGGARSEIRPEWVERVGTEVRVHVTPGHEECLDPLGLAATLRRQADLLHPPVFLRVGRPGEASEVHGPLNRRDAPWHATAWSDPRRRVRLCSAFLAARGHAGALAVLPVHLEAPVRARGVLFVPAGPGSVAGGQLDVYVRRMLVREKEGDLLPSWAGFVGGVVESPDLQPVASREGLRRDAAFGALRAQLAVALVARLSRLARRTPSRAQRMLERFPGALESAALAEDALFDGLWRLLRFESSRGVVSLGELVGDRRKQDGPLLVSVTRRGVLATGPRAGARAASEERLVIAPRGALDEELLTRAGERLPGRLHLVPLRGDPAEPRWERPPPGEREAWQAFERAVQEALARRGLEEIEVRAGAFAPVDLPARVHGQAHAVARRLDALTREPWLVPDLAEATREVLGAPPESIVVVFNTAHSMVRELLRRDCRAASPCESAVVAFALSALLREDALAGRERVERLHEEIVALATDVVAARAREPGLPFGSEPA